MLTFVSISIWKIRYVYRHVNFQFRPVKRHYAQLMRTFKWRKNGYLSQELCRFLPKISHNPTGRSLRTCVFVHCYCLFKKLSHNLFSQLPALFFARAMEVRVAPVELSYSNPIRRTSFFAAFTAFRCGGAAVVECRFELSLCNVFFLNHFVSSLLHVC